MTKLKAIIMDGDGSSITHDGILPDNLRDLMQANPQIHWIMATGRSLDLLRHLPIIDYLSPDVPHILDGGSRLTKTNGESLLDFFISPAELESFFAQLDLTQIDFLYYYLDEQRSYLYSQQLELWQNRPMFTRAITHDNITEYRQIALANPPTKIFMRVKEFFELHDLTWHNNEKNIDFTAHGVNKGSTCLRLLETLQIKPEQAAFVFNDRNDLPLVLHPELAQITTIKVGDYLPEINATHHVATPYDVAEVLEKLIAEIQQVN